MLDATRVLIVSSHRSEAVVDNVLANGAHGYIPKPFTPEDFISKVRHELSAGGDVAS